MAKYIDAEKLKDEITRIYNEHPVHISERYEDGFDDGYHGCCDEIVAIIDSLQQEQAEVDLEEEVRNYMEIHHLHIKDGGRVVFDNGDSPNFMCDIREIARHFYELGKKQ